MSSSCKRVSYTLFFDIALLLGVRSLVYRRAWAFFMHYRSLLLANAFTKVHRAVNIETCHATPMHKFMSCVGNHLIFTPSMHTSCGTGRARPVDSNMSLCWNMTDGEPRGQGKDPITANRTLFSVATESAYIPLSIFLSFQGPSPCRMLNPQQWSRNALSRVIRFDQWNTTPSLALMVLCYRNEIPTGRTGTCIYYCDHEKALAGI